VVFKHITTRIQNSPSRRARGKGPLVKGAEPRPSSGPSPAQQIKATGHRRRTTKQTAENVDDYIEKAPKEVRDRLGEVRAAIREAAPTALEGISYQIPYYDYKGALVWFGLMKRHIGVYLRPPVIEEHGGELAGYVTTKSSVHLPLDRRIPVRLIRRLVRARMRENEAEFREMRRKKGTPAPAE